MEPPLHNGIIEIIEYPDNFLTHLAVPHPTNTEIQQVEAFLNHDTDPGVVELYSLDTHQKAQGNRLATHMFDFVVCHALELGYSYMRSSIHSEYTGRLFRRFSRDKLWIEHSDGICKPREIESLIQELSDIRRSDPKKRGTTSMLRSGFIITAALSS